MCSCCRHRSVPSHFSLLGFARVSTPRHDHDKSTTLFALDSLSSRLHGPIPHTGGWFEKSASRSIPLKPGRALPFNNLMFCSPPTMRVAEPVELGVRPEGSIARICGLALTSSIWCSRYLAKALIDGVVMRWHPSCMWPGSLGRPLYPN